MLEQLFGGRPPETHADVAKALGITASNIKLERWWWKGQPAPDVFFASVRVSPEAVGELAGRLIKAGLVIDGFPIGKPAFDAAILNITNVPREIAG
jgi:hypothetical protein